MVSSDKTIQQRYPYQSINIREQKAEEKEAAHRAEDHACSHVCQREYGATCHGNYHSQEYVNYTKNACWKRWNKSIGKVLKDDIRDPSSTRYI